MIRTEEQARELWCPMVRRESFRFVATQAPYLTEAGSAVIPLAAGVNRDVSTTAEHDLPKCIASKCAMWRWAVIDPINYEDGKASGYCGLAGRPWEMDE